MAGDKAKEPPPQSRWRLFFLVGLVPGLLVYFISRYWSSREDHVEPGVDRFRSPFMELMHASGAVMTGVEVHEFPNGIGISTTTPLPKGTSILSFPDSLVIGPFPKSSSPVHDGQKIDQKIHQDVAQSRISPFTATLSKLVVVLQARLPPTYRFLSNYLSPDDFTQLYGLFSVPKAEFVLAATGTSMENMRDEAEQEAAAALDYLKMLLTWWVDGGGFDESASPVSASVAMDVNIERVKAAYILLQSHKLMLSVSDSAGETAPALVLPLLLARATPQASDSVSIHYDEATRMFDVLLDKRIGMGQEIYRHDPEMSDATVWAFRGLTLSKRHRMKLHITLENWPKSKEVTDAWMSYKCVAGERVFWLENAHESHLISCLRLFSVPPNVESLEQLKESGWLRHWPVTVSLSQANELRAATLGLIWITPVLERMNSVSKEIIERFGNETVSRRPVFQVRAEELRLLEAAHALLVELSQIAENEVSYNSFVDMQNDKLAQHEKTKREG